MDREMRIEARNQYLKYFRIWFIVIAILAVITMIIFVSSRLQEKTESRNTQAPAERVYDLADVLTDSEEESLRDLIARREEEIKGHIVLVTTNLAMEGAGALYDGSWENNMMNTADAFYDQKGYGYDQPCGDGVLILDNWYEGQAGNWLSTCGRLIGEFGDYEINRVLDEIYYEIEYGNGAYEGYRNGIEEIAAIAGSAKESLEEGAYWLGAFLISTVTAVIYIFTKLRNKEGEKTVTAGTYVEGSPVANIKQDQFIRKVVTRRRIPKQNSSGGRSGSGGGRSHRSSGGVSHGGGGRRR